MKKREPSLLAELGIAVASRRMDDAAAVLRESFASERWRRITEEN